MAFWSENFGESLTMKDPKRKFRFKVEFQGIGTSATGGAMLWYAKTCTKPGFQISTTEHKYLNHTFFYPGSVTWQDITVTLVDPTDPDMVATLSAMVEGSGYSPPTDSTDLNSMSKARAANALGTVIITQIDAEGKDLEQWTLWNSFITELKFGDLEYGGDDLTEISVTLKYDWARLKVTETDGSVASVETTSKTEFFAG
ncbi:hypothetical protein CMI47_17115 [Candidatus Pacearchaeota archaeon]|nr:hypothetical protein [Candidatus Pacearchaeota archaeon]|tara:strand:+ start:3093 stop:3692 length:600 start_codon:yes stop_codon:yes gene_type:complete